MSLIDKCSVLTVVPSRCALCAKTTIRNWPMITNRRKYHRITVDEKCVVTIDGATLDCSLVDQSINGAKIAGLDFLVVPFGKVITVKVDDESFEAVIRGVTRDEAGKMLIGIQRSETVDDADESSDAMLLNCFIRHDGNLMVCIPINVEPDGRVKIQLWDGMQFPINYSALETMNRTERYTSLMTGSNLKMIAELYGLGSVPMSQLADKIFEFEFGSLHNCNAKQAYALGR